MIYNPFDEHSYVNPVASQMCRQLENRIEHTPESEAINCAVYGLSGSGKSEFLDTFFSPDRCRELARKKMLFPMLKAEEQIEPGTFFYSICKKVAEYAASYAPEVGLCVPQEGQGRMSDYLEVMLTALTKAEYRVSLVIDEFQRLAQSERIKDTDYSKFRSLHSTKQLGYIVATDYDFEKTNSKNSEQFNTSFFTEIFAKKRLQLSGMKKEEFDQFLDGFFPEGEQCPFTVSERELIFSVSGGILGLAHTAAWQLCEMKIRGMQDETVFRQQIRENFKYNYFKKWCSDLSDLQRALLGREATENTISTYCKGDEYIPYEIIKSRGFIVQDEDPTGQNKSGNGNMRFCCSLFREYAGENFASTKKDIVVEVIAPPEQAVSTICPEMKEIQNKMEVLLKQIETRIEECKNARKPEAVEMTRKRCETLHDGMKKNMDQLMQYQSQPQMVEVMQKLYEAYYNEYEEMES